MGILRKVFFLPEKELDDEEAVSKILQKMNSKQKQFLRRKLSDIAGDEDD